jgi:predicted secreted protein
MNFGPASTAREPVDRLRLGGGHRKSLSPGTIRHAEVHAFEQRLGAGGTYNFWFQPKTAGRTDLTLVYRRSWETDIAPLKTYKITIAVQ